MRVTKVCPSEVVQSKKTQNVKRSQDPLRRAMSKSQREQNLNAGAKEPEADQSWSILPRVRAGISEKPSDRKSALVLKISSNCLKIA